MTTGNAVFGSGTGNGTRVSIDGGVVALNTNTAVLLNITRLGSDSTTGVGNHAFNIGTTGLLRSEGNGTSRDSITDFTPGQDRIDVSGFMAGAIWRGTSA